jgi:hypothetical protein
MRPIPTTDADLNSSRLLCVDAVIAAGLEPAATDRLLRELFSRWREQEQPNWHSEV